MLPSPSRKPAIYAKFTLESLPTVLPIDFCIWINYRTEINPKSTILFYITNPFGYIRYHGNRGLHFFRWLFCGHRYGCHSVLCDGHQLLFSDGFLSFYRNNHPDSAIDSDTANAFGSYTTSGFTALVCSRFSGCPHTNSLSKSKA